MQTAYDPVRIRRLSAHTMASIDALAMLRSSDPAAAGAVRCARLLRHNLEDLWMPLLRRIETSTAMVTWLAGALSTVESGREMIVDWIEDRATRPRDSDSTYAAIDDDELLVLISFIDDDGLPSGGPERLASELARRVRHDRDFARRLIDMAGDHPLIGLAVAAADFPPPFVRDVAISMLHRASRFDDFPTRSEAAAADSVLTELTKHPGASLDLLLDGKALFELAASPFLDTGTVESLVHSGMYAAVRDDPTRLQDGFRVIGQLTKFANDELDGGFGAGMARGVATSVIGYVDTLGPAIGKENGGRVRVTTFDDHPFTIDLGAYEEVRNLFGAVARDAESQAAIGVALGAYMNHVIDDLGATVIARSGVEHVAQFADLIGDAVAAEQAEMVAAAAAATAQRRELADGVGFAVNAGLSAIGVGRLVSFGVKRVVKAGTDSLSRVDPDTMPNGSLRHVTYDAILVATVTLARSDRGAQISNGLDDDDPAVLRQIDERLERLAALSAAGDTAGYRDEVSDLARFIEARTTALDEFVNAVTNVPAVHELIEGHS